jgi:hypothetical protein
VFASQALRLSLCFATWGDAELEDAGLVLTATGVRVSSKIAAACDSLWAEPINGDLWASRAITPYMICPCPENATAKKIARECACGLDAEKSSCTICFLIGEETGSKPGVYGKTMTPHAKEIHDHEYLSPDGDHHRCEFSGEDPASQGTCTGVGIIKVDQYDAGETVTPRRPPIACLFHLPWSCTGLL